MRPIDGEEKKEGQNLIPGPINNERKEKN